ncbi:putative inorganic phosphate cotransporter, partial [Hyposmocoma kahamanoa]|uniref:putative inorganic phosphate cotransporter n=1 Tax=Hyposmocoma kahamanoa TaxID=1477025 RepID=UPI000E6D6EFD
SLGVRHVQMLMLFLAMIVCHMMRANITLAIVTMTDTGQEDTFDWSTQMQSVIMSSFFWGYAILQIPAGEMAAKFGGHILILLCVGVNSVLTLLLPFGSYYGDWQLVCAFRVLQGLSQG